MHHTTKAIALRTVPYGEHDLVLTLLSPELGRTGGLAKGARRSQRRFEAIGDLFHTSEFAWVERRGELVSLTGSRVVTPRLGLCRDLRAFDAASALLRWVRTLAAPRRADARLFARVEGALDAFAALPSASIEARLVSTGFALLADAGYAMTLEACVACGRACEGGQRAFVDPVRGGVLCRRCGGGGAWLLSGDERRWIMNAQHSTPHGLSQPEFEAGAPDAGRLRPLLDQLLIAHTHGEA